MGADITPVVFEEALTQIAFIASGQPKQPNSYPLDHALPYLHLSVRENENWTEVFVIKYIQGNSRKWT